MNVPAIEQFVLDINEVINAFVIVREDLYATDRLWPVLSAPAIQSIRIAVEQRLTAAKTAANALVVP